MPTSWFRRIPWIVRRDQHSAAGPSRVQQVRAACGTSIGRWRLLYPAHEPPQAAAHCKKRSKSHQTPLIGGAGGHQTWRTISSGQGASPASKYRPRIAVSSLHAAVMRRSEQQRRAISCECSAPVQWHRTKRVVHFGLDDKRPLPRALPCRITLCRPMTEPQAQRPACHGSGQPGGGRSDRDPAACQQVLAYLPSMTDSSRRSSFTHQRCRP